MAAGDRVNLVAGQVPPLYHCKCEYCSQVIGELVQPDGSYYSRNERRKYYVEEERGEGGHIAKTPVHIARWAVQQYTQPGDWVLDPTIGAGTTAVEAMTQGRNAAGMELEYGDILEANVRKAKAMAMNGVDAIIAPGDSRKIKEDFLDVIKKEFTLIVNNPPYKGDVSHPSPAKEGYGPQFRHLERKFEYKKELPNLAHLKENAEYWRTMEAIYRVCVERLVPGGHFVTGIKDPMKKKEPYLIHKGFCEILSKIGLKFEGTAFLKHHPTTLNLNSYKKKWGVQNPLYQTISVFKKE